MLHSGAADFLSHGKESCALSLLHGYLCLLHVVIFSFFYHDVVLVVSTTTDPIIVVSFTPMKRREDALLCFVPADLLTQPGASV